MKTKTLTTISLGIALYVVLSYLIPIRVIGNYFLCLGYVILVVYPYVYGKFAGLAVGFFGTLLYCILASSYNGMVGWVLGNAFIGFVLGMVFDKTKKMSNPLKAVIDIAAMAISCAIGIILIKSLTETILFRVPILVRLSANSAPFVMDLIVMVVAYPVAILFDKRARR